MPSSPPTALGGSALSLSFKNKRPMERSPWAFTFLFYFLCYFTFFSFSSPNSQPSYQCLQAHPLCWVGLLFYFSSCKKKRPMERSPHSYPQLSGGVVRAEEACALNEQMKSKPSPPKDFHSWSRITIASDVAASFSDQQ